MRIPKVSPVVPTTQVKRRTKRNLYQSTIDPAVIIHSNKTHRSVSEAFKDAEYASPITKFKSDWQLSLEFLGGALYGFWMVGMALLIPILLLLWLTK